MRARFVNEFERGVDPKKTLGMGYEAIMQNRGPEIFYNWAKKYMEGDLDFFDLYKKCWDSKFLFKYMGTKKIFEQKQKYAFKNYTYDEIRNGNSPDESLYKLLDIWNLFLNNDAFIDNVRKSNPSFWEGTHSNQIPNDWQYQQFCCEAILYFIDKWPASIS